MARPLFTDGEQRRCRCCTGANRGRCLLFRPIGVMREQASLSSSPVAPGLARGRIASMPGLAWDQESITHACSRSQRRCTRPPDDISEIVAVQPFRSIWSVVRKMLRGTSCTEGNPPDFENARAAHEPVERLAGRDRRQPMADNSDNGVVTLRNNFSVCRSDRSNAEGRVGLRRTVVAQDQQLLRVPGTAVGRQRP